VAAVFGLGPFRGSAGRPPPEMGRRAHAAVGLALRPTELCWDRACAAGSAPLAPAHAAASGVAVTGPPGRVPDAADSVPKAWPASPPESVAWRPAAASRPFSAGPTVAVPAAPLGRCFGQALLFATAWCRRGWRCQEERVFSRIGPQKRSPRNVSRPYGECAGCIRAPQVSFFEARHRRRGRARAAISAAWRQGLLHMDQTSRRPAAAVERSLPGLSHGSFSAFA
jgi:hypothetical protein